MADQLREIVQQDVERLRDDGKLGGEGKATAIARCLRTLREIDQLTGDGLSEEQVLRAPAMERVLDAVRGALAQHPAALRDVLTALEKRGT